MMERQKELLPLWAVLTFFAGVFGVVAVIPLAGTPSHCLSHCTSYFIAFDMRDTGA